MIKIDLHLHTIATDKDNVKRFEFDIDRLKSYVYYNRLSAIAITNHNVFDIEQYKEICDELKECKVFPGIEVDYNNGHILVISDDSDSALNEFNQSCIKLHNVFNKNASKKFIDKKEFLNIFGDPKKYLIIPHYKKDSRDLSIEKIKELDDKILWGEVGNHKKFIRCIKDNNSLTPLLFSDFKVNKAEEKIKQINEPFPSKFTYVDLNIDYITINKLKVCFSSKSMVAINYEKNNQYFYVLKDNLKIVDGLNLIIGARSSGKSYILNSIENTYKNNEDMDILYIKQFQITNESNDEEIINKFKAPSNELVDQYLEEFSYFVNQVSKIDLNERLINLNDYMTKLHIHSRESELKDIFSQCSLFNDPDELIKHDDTTLELIKAVYTIYKHTQNDKYNEIINKYIDVNNLIYLISELFEIYNLECVENYSVSTANKWAKVISTKLQQYSSVTPKSNFDFNNLYKELLVKKLFNKFIADFPDVKEFKKESLFDKFFVRTYVKKNTNIDDIYKSSKILKKHINRLKLEILLKENPYSCLSKVMFDNEIDKTDLELYKIFLNKDFIVVDEYGSNLSGGQKAELNLLYKLNLARKSDIVLIDELEPSFDNVYIFEDLLRIIKDIAKESIVILSTHNHNLGVLLEPDNLIYTERKYDVNSGNNIYKQYYGHFMSDYLYTSSNEAIKTKDAYIKMMEGGTDPFNRRKNIYESFKN